MAGLSSRNLEQLPKPEELELLCKSLAMLEAILSPEWESRYYSFNRNWNEGRRMASMRTGCGDEYFISFQLEGAIMKGFAHESSMANAGRMAPPR